MARRWNRRQRAVLLGLLALALVGLGGARAYLSSPGFRAATLARIETEFARRIPGARVGQFIEVSLWGTVTLGPVELVSPVDVGSDVAEPLFHATAVVVQVSPWSILRGQPKPRGVELLEVRLAAAGHTLLVEEVALELAQTAEGLRAEGTLSLDGSNELELDLLWTGEALDARAHADGFDLARLFGPALAHHEIELLRGRLAGDFEVHATPKYAEVVGNVTLRDALVAGERIATEPVELPRITAHARLGYAPQRSKVVVDELRAELGVEAPAFAELHGQLDLRRTGTFAFDALAHAGDFATLVKELPASLRPDQRVAVPQGRLAATAKLSGSTHAADTWDLTTKLDLAGLEAHGRTVPTFLRGEFNHTAVDGLGRTHSFVVGPSDGRFVDIDTLPAHVTRAVTTSEDAGFFAHQGFDFAELKNSAVEALEPGGRVRGGSTISQQLAKNLFLTRERTLSRKAREALITVALEATLPKKRLLEIYLNVIEWGPGLYGIGPAAKHYFGKHATQLTATEAAYLASIIPNPVRYYAYFTRGALTPTWHDRVATLLGKMHTLGYLDDAAHARAVEAPLSFARASGL